jgi:hypothetical protein
VFASSKCLQDLGHEKLQNNIKSKSIKKTKRKSKIKIIKLTQTIIFRLSSKRSINLINDDAMASQRKKIFIESHEKI